MVFQADPIYWLTEAEWKAHLDHEGRWDPQCTVITKRGTRCLHRIFGGQVYTIVNSGAYISQVDMARLDSGACAFHAKLQDSK